jgi:small subunit ribosomal protein S6
MQTMREYETLYILHPEIAEDAMTQVNERLQDVLNRQGAKVLRCAVWGKKKLAFEVQKNPKGVYVQMTYLSMPEVIREFERNLRMLEAVMRYQTIKVAEEVDVDRRLAEQATEDRLRAEQETRAKAEQEARAAERAAEQEASEQASEDDSDVDEDADDSDDSNSSDLSDEED